MISLAMTVTACVAVTSYLTASFFRRTVVDHTADVLSKAEKVSFGLVAHSVCSSTIMLVLVSNAAAQTFLSGDSAKHVLAAKDDTAEPNPCLTDDDDASPTLNPADTFSLLQSPSSSRIIESTESITRPITPCTVTVTATSSNCKRLSVSIDSNITTLAHYDDDFSDDASDTDDYESLGSDDSIFHEDDFSSGHSSTTQYTSDQTTLDNLIAQMEALTLDDPPRPSKLRPLILVTNRQHKTSTPYTPVSAPAFSIDTLTRRMEGLSLSASLPEPDYAMDALILSMEALSLSDALPSISKLKPLILLTKRAAGQLELRPPPTTAYHHIDTAYHHIDTAYHHIDTHRNGLPPCPSQAESFPPKRKLEPARGRTPTLHTVFPMSQVPYDQSGRRTNPHDGLLHCPL
ncbi:hypothetical protein DFH29DRAFT_1034739, partial [Suillus ampliporus]